VTSPVSLLIVLGHAPYDGSDVAWNALRLAGAAQAQGTHVRLFLINDGVQAARTAPPDVEFDLASMVSQLAADGVEVLLCGTCLTRCGIGGGELVAGAEPGTMDGLASWIVESERVISF
jgi:uncharacterized protein involved in oxidation of intracellular sulfur